ncbi:MAG: 16S rRNA (guanine(966)-N(2))-methyltransferase RsmD, partial [Nitrospirae bacterium]|nr:16S rRNA (guanine(966)-N(2))-methyltransferase RsmD [Nitrospirota bacterium]
PTSAKVREAIFNIVGSRVTGCAFLDLYAGTGVVGIEALSRGAEMAVFIEEDPISVKILRELIEEFGFKERAMVIKDNASHFLNKTDIAFDLIFADPPYKSDELEAVFAIIGERDILKEGGLAVAEHSSKKKVPSDFGGLRLKKSYRYGDTTLTTYETRDLSGHI